MKKPFSKERFTKDAARKRKKPRPAEDREPPKAFLEGYKSHTRRYGK